MAAAAQRYLQLLGDNDPTLVLSATPARLEDWLAGVDPTALDDAVTPLGFEAGGAEVRGDGPVTPRLLLARLADVEIVAGFRLRQLIALPGVELQAVDHGLWSRRYQRLEPSLALEAFRALRSWNLALLAGFSLEDWLAEGFDPDRGFESCDQLVRQLAGHDLESLIRLGIDSRGPGTSVP